MAKQYHKLVRDKIPQIIKDNGQICRTKVLEEEEYLRMLEEKLAEELAEFRESKELEELADLLEVMRALVTARGNTWEDLEAVREEKCMLRGGFAQRIALLEVGGKQPEER